MVLLYGEHWMILTSTVFDWSTRVTDRQTDGQIDWDRRTGIYRQRALHICSRVLKTDFIFFTTINTLELTTESRDVMRPDRFFVFLAAERKLIVFSHANLNVVWLAVVQDANRVRKLSVSFAYSNQERTLLCMPNVMQRQQSRSTNLLYLGPTYLYL